MRTSTIGSMLEKVGRSMRGGSRPAGRRRGGGYAAGGTARRGGGLMSKARRLLR